MQLNNVIIYMKRETVHKKIKLGTLVRIDRLGEYGIVTQSFSWGNLSPDSDICYVVFVKGKEVKAYEEGLTVIGD